MTHLPLEIAIRAAGCCVGLWFCGLGFKGSGKAIDAILDGKRIWGWGRLFACILGTVGGAYLSAVSVAMWWPH